MTGETVDDIPEGNLYAAGGNSEGQLGLGDCEERTSFQAVDFFSGRGPIKMLSAGCNISAALTVDGTLYMWGDNSEGQIGLGDESIAVDPQEVTVGRPVSWVSCGYYHSAFVTADGDLFTFGEPEGGKLGLSHKKLANHRVPQLVVGITDPVTQVSCGSGHTVALTEEDLYTFGLGQFGQLGHGTFIFKSPVPKAVEHFRKGRVSHVACGENHTAVITGKADFLCSYIPDTGLLYTFGDGRHGKLGLGEENFTNQFKPTLCPRFLQYRDDDVTENYLEKSYMELLGVTCTSSTLNRSLSARLRRRERERSPEQFGKMFRTLPSLTYSYFDTSLPISSQTLPARRPPRDSLSPSSPRTGRLKQEKSKSEKPSVAEDTEDDKSTHVMKVNHKEKTLALSPIHKEKAGCHCVGPL
ncbi:hypothetical protein JZ751_023617 [Albula glossodonta]|uniref:RCC1-like domain-containing protein n=1 Tax=Albula glossodonta TaxID=121402 RepID=A0A8T2NPI2_9TELE|nr:hypothetical protein JZ751_023617 [Albula glossodonta]